MADSPEPDVGSSPGGPPADDPLPGTMLGDYRVEKAIAWGGMGIVYVAVHPLIGRKVAVKVLRPSFAADPEQVSRFLAEAQAISSIKHRGIIDIIGFGKVPDGRQYMVMEFLDGETLEAVMQREGAMVPARALAILEELLDALSAAHKAGVVHRDLKPANVYICLQSNGTKYVKLVDFGLARRATIAELQRGSGKASIMAGTPEYFSPEQARGTAATPRTDLYGLGVMLFEMITGELPFKADSVIELLNAHLTQRAPRASTRVSGLPAPIDDLIAQLLEKQPELRPTSADSVRQAVIRISRQLKDEATVVKTVGPPPEDEKTRRMVPTSDTDRLAAPPAGLKPRVSAGDGKVRSIGRVPAPPSSGPRRSGGAAAVPRAPDTAPEFELPAAPARTEPRVADTQPRLPSSIAPKWIAAAAGLTLLGLGAAAWTLTRPAEVNPIATNSPPIEPAPGIGAGLDVPEVEPPRPLPPSEDLVPLPPKKVVPRVVKALPEACEGDDWQAKLRTALSRLDQALAAGRPEAENKAALDEEGALHKRISAGRTKADCANIARDLQAFRARHGL